MAYEAVKRERKGGLMGKGRGWHGEPGRHADAARGIKTGRKKQPMKEHVSEWIAMEGLEPPRTLYHATRTANVEGIMKHGLRRTKGGGNFPGFDTEGLIFMVDNERDARFFGSAAALEAGDPKLDFTIILVDSLKTRTVYGVPIVGAPGLDPVAFKGTQYIANESIPPEALTLFRRVYMDGGRIKTTDYK